MILKAQLCAFSDGRIIFEYIIPRMGKRVDAVVLYRSIVFLLEFKVGDSESHESAYDQVYDYAPGLRNFRHSKLLACLTISTRAPEQPCVIYERERIIEPILCNAHNIGAAIEYIAAHYDEPAFDYE